MGRVTSLDGSPIAFDRMGSGPPVVLVHAGFVDRRSCLLVAHELASRFTVVLVDRRGRGDSGPYREDHRIEREFEDVAAIVGALGGPVTLVGHSSSAWYVLYGARLAGGVHRLVLYEPPPLWIVPARVVGEIDAAVKAGAVDDAVEHLLVGATRMPPTEAAVIRGSPVWQQLAANAGAFVPELDAGRRFRFDPMLFRDFSTPTLLLLGTESPPFLRPITEQVAAALPDARIRELDRQGHGAMSTAPALFAAVVAAFTDDDELETTAKERGSSVS